MVNTVHLHQLPTTSWDCRGPLKTFRICYRHHLKHTLPIDQQRFPHFHWELDLPNLLFYENMSGYESIIGSNFHMKHQIIFREMIAQNTALKQTITPNRYHRVAASTWPRLNNSRLANPAVSSPKTEAASRTSAIAASISGVTSIFAFRAVRETVGEFWETNATDGMAESVTRSNEMHFIVGVIRWVTSDFLSRKMIAQARENGWWVKNVYYLAPTKI